MLCLSSCYLTLSMQCRFSGVLLLRLFQTDSSSSNGCVSSIEKELQLFQRYGRCHQTRHCDRRWSDGIWNCPGNVTSNRNVGYLLPSALWDMLLHYCVVFPLIIIELLFFFQVAACAGQSVCLVETNDKLLQGAQSRIQESLKRVAKKVYKV